MSEHWAKTPEGRARISRALKAAWKRRKAVKKAKKREQASMADRAVRAAVRKGRPQAQKAPRMGVRVLSTNPDGGLDLETASMRTWGELVDLMTGKYAGIVVHEVRIEVGR